MYAEKYIFIYILLTSLKGKPILLGWLKVVRKKKFILSKKPWVSSKIKYYLRLETINKYHCQTKINNILMSPSFEELIFINFGLKNQTNMTKKNVYYHFTGFGENGKYYTTCNYIIKSMVVFFLTVIF